MSMLDDIERDLLRIGRELAGVHGRVNAVRLVALGAGRHDGADEWYSEAEHYLPLVEAHEALATARQRILKAVREVQGTNPIPSHAVRVDHWRHVCGADCR
jgi:hypothetical protein